jgi:hypothetical protein
VWESQTVTVNPGKETKMTKALLSLLLLSVGATSTHAASCTLPASTSAASATYSGTLYGADGSVTKVSKCPLVGLLRFGDAAATFQFDNTCGPLPVLTMTGFATRLTKNGSNLAECSAWDTDSGGDVTIVSIIKTDPATGAPKSEKDVITDGFSGQVFVGKLTAKY